MLWIILVHGFCPLKTKITQFPAGFRLNPSLQANARVRRFLSPGFFPWERWGTVRACLKSRLLNYDECKITFDLHSRIIQTWLLRFSNFVLADKSWTCLHPVFLKFSSLFFDERERSRDASALSLCRSILKGFLSSRILPLSYREEPLSCWL